MKNDCEKPDKPLPQYGTIRSHISNNSSEKFQLSQHHVLIPTMPATFEQAIVATDFGRFNYILLILALFTVWGCVFVTTNMSFVIPAAQCDLNLSLIDMGLLNASPFLGMILSAFLWGYLADTYGRRNILIYGFILDSICNLICTFSYNMHMLLILKFLSGFIVSGPFAVMMSYLSEFHAAKYRSKIIITTGIYAGTVNLILPLLAWYFMRFQNIVILNYVIQPWKLFILICAIPSMVCGLCYIMMPESPKFLMTVNKYDEALTILKDIYTLNTGNPPESYPVKELLLINNKVPVSSEKGKIEMSYATRGLKKGWNQMKPLFVPPYLWTLLLVLVIQFCTVLGSNTLRLWLPQLFTAIDEYEQYNTSNTSASICDMMNYSVHKPTHNHAGITIENTECSIVYSNDQVYINSAIVGSFAIIVGTFTALIINKVKKKLFLIIIFLTAGCSGICLMWATNPVTILCLSSLYNALTGVAAVTIVSIVVELFPTSLRTMTVSLTMMTGRIGTIFGNVIFSILLGSGCIPPFLLIGGILIVCILPLIILPSPRNDDEFH